MHRFVVLLLALSSIPNVVLAAEPPKLSLLIVDGMNNHDWPRATKILKEILEGSGQFKVEVSTSPSADASKEAWDKWRPDFHEVRRGAEQLQRRPHGQGHPLAQGSREGPGGLRARRRRAGHLPFGQQLLSQLARLQRDDRPGLAGQELRPEPDRQS